MFRALPAADLERALRGLVPVAGGLGHVAIDGKRLRGSQKEASPGVHLLTAFATRLQATVAALVVPPDSAEMVDALALIRELPLGPGDVVAGDAAFTYRPAVEAIQATGAAYFLLVKANQPELQAELAHAFGDDVPVRVAAAAGTEDRRREPPELARAETVDKEHGRIETRRIAVRRRRRGSPRSGRASPASAGSSAYARPPPPARARSSTPSPACRRRRPRPVTCFTSPGRTGKSRTGCSGSATAPSGGRLPGPIGRGAGRARPPARCLPRPDPPHRPAPKAAREAFAANPKAAIKAACNGMD